MNPDIERGKALLLREHAKQVKAKHPSWSFSQCWQSASLSNPQLTEEFADAQKQPQESESTLAAILEKYTSRRIEASPSNSSKLDDEELMLVMAEDGSVVDLVLE